MFYVERFGPRVSGKVVSEVEMYGCWVLGSRQCTVEVSELNPSLGLRVRV